MLKNITKILQLTSNWGLKLKVSPGSATLTWSRWCLHSRCCGTGCGCQGPVLLLPGTCCWRRPKLSRLNAQVDWVSALARFYRLALRRIARGRWTPRIGERHRKTHSTAPSGPLSSWGWLAFWKGLPACTSFLSRARDCFPRVSIPQLIYRPTWSAQTSGSCSWCCQTVLLSYARGQSSLSRTRVQGWWLLCLRGPWMALTQERNY
jgi:hypothetical protein